MTETEFQCPAFIDNRNGNTLAKALRAHFDALHQADATPDELCIATGYFNAAGWLKIADAVERLPKVRLLLGAEPTPATERAIRMPEDPPEAERIKRRVHDALSSQVRALREERDRAFDFTPEVIGRFKRLRSFFQRESVEVRRYPDRFFHAKAWLFRGQDTIAGSSNLTAAGMSTNLELNLGHHDAETVRQVETWFDEVWGESNAYDLAGVYADLFREWSPYEIYLRVLYELYGSEIEEEPKEEARVSLTRFQKHGIWRAKRILERYGGVVVADGVGLGKTFTAGGIMEEYQDRRQRILLIRPAALQKTWDNFLNRNYLGNVETVSYEGLAMDEQLADDQTKHVTNNLLRKADEYQLVVIDEAHNYRNPDARTRAAVLRRLLRGPRRDLVMLTATPVNNSLLDLYHLLRFFVKQDSRLIDYNIPSLKGVFDRARKEEPEDLNPDILYPVIDATTVKRTRSFIKKHYPNDKIPGPDGNLVRITFPKPIPKTVRYKLTDVLPDFMARFEEALQPSQGRPTLTMARYQPDMYLKNSPRNPENEGSLVGLLRSGLLKRFESSAIAFTNTCQKMARQHEQFLAALNEGHVIQKKFFKEISAADDIDLNELLSDSENTESTEDYDVKRLRGDVENDLQLLQEFAAQTGSISPDKDPKLEALIETLATIASEAEAEGIGEVDTRDKKKVVLFSFFKDTAVWIRDYLIRQAETDPRLAPYRGRIAATSGSPDDDGLMSPEKAVFGFAPTTAAPDSWTNGDQYDLLIATDVLAEGVNLQQARHVINYDLPWNPMRLIQRHGRIDRLLSRHDRVFVRTFFPTDSLENLLNLESRVRDKLALAAASIGVEDSPIEDGAQRAQAFAETRSEIEKIQSEETEIFEQGGTASAAQTGEEYRADLRKALQGPLGSLIPELPWKAGSGMVQGDQSGHFFCARIGKDRTYLRFVPDDASNSEEVIKEIGTCLRLITCDEETARVLPDHAIERAFTAWGIAQRSIWEEWSWQTDPANLQPAVPKINREVEQFLGMHPPDGVERTDLERISTILLSPWQVRDQNHLRQVWSDTYESQEQKAIACYEAVIETGIEPVEAPRPLPAISPDQVHLVCWLAVQKV